MLGLGAVSFLTDASGEMIYPLLPLLLTGALGASLAHVGLIEGAAEGTASLLKLLSGRLSDRMKRRKPLVLLGYSLTALMRPCLALAQGPLGVLALRLGDRIGKGLRGGPRDALLADATPPEMRGRAYGFNRAMDNAGALVGPLLAYLLLSFGLGIRSVFLLAAVPGVLAVLALLTLVKEKDRELSVPAAVLAPPGSAIPEEPRNLPASLRRYLIVLAVFSLGNSSDAFLLLWARDSGVPAAQIPLLWAAHNGLKALLGQPLGALSDRWGRRRLILLGWATYAAVYAGCATLQGKHAVWGLLGLYAIYYALVEGAEKALVADLAPRELRGRAFGWFHAVLGTCALPASLLYAALYRGSGGPTAAFGVGAALAAIAALLLVLWVPATDRGKGTR